MHQESPLPGKPSPEAIREELERVLASKVFAACPRLKKFLQFGVDAALAGQSPNEYAVAVDAFERGSEFDPRLDPIVRVHAGRLRSKLADYYSSEGAQDPIEISLPLRSYIPEFAYRMSPRGSTPERENPVSSIGVFPFVPLSPDSGMDHFAEGLTREIVYALCQLNEVRVVSLSGQENPRTMPAQVSIKAWLSGSVRNAGSSRVRISAELLKVADGMVLWSQMYEVPVGDFIATQERIAKEITDALRMR